MTAVTTKPEDCCTYFGSFFSSSQTSLDPHLDTPSYFPIRSSTSNYLNRCVEELRPENAPNNCKAWLWTIASVATIAALGVLVGVGFATVGALAATGTPIFSFTLALVGVTFCTASVVVKFAEKFLFNARQALGEANSLKEISQRFNQLPNEGNSIVGKLANISILWSSIRGMQQPENLSVLNPLIARYDYWVNQKALWEQKVERSLALATDLALAAGIAITVPTGEAESALQKSLKTHFKNQQEALICKVYAAFTHAIIQRPDFVGDFGNLANFIQASLEVRCLAEEVGIANELVRFHPNLNVRPITINEIKTQPITVIAQRFIQAIPAPV